MPPPDALLLLSRHCGHCPAMLAALADLVKEGSIGRLEVVNVESHPEVARAHGARSVPWVRIGPFSLAGARGREELAHWARRVDSPEGMADYLHTLLKEGQLDAATRMLREQPAQLAALLPIVANPDASLNVRIGAGALFETFSGEAPLADLIPALGGLTLHADARVRADACHYLGLAGSPAVLPYLRACLDDAHPEVREIAQDGLDALQSTPRVS